MRYFTIQFLAGLRYAALFLLISALMGMLYGIFGGLLVSAAIIGVTMTGIFVVLNFPVAVLFFIGGIFPVLFGGSNRAGFRYFALSLAFLLVFMLFFGLLKISGLQPF